MSMYACTVCKKEFKTTQHLNQHKNKKKVCSLNSSDNVLTTSTSLLKNNELSSNDIMKFISTYKTFQDLIKDKEMLAEYKEKLIQLQNENNILKQQLKLINNVIKNTTEKNIKEVTAKVVKETAHIAVEKIINKDDTLILLNKNNNDDDDDDDDYDYDYDYDNHVNNTDEGFSPDIVTTKCFD